MTIQTTKNHSRKRITIGAENGKERFYYSKVALHCFPFRSYLQESVMYRAKFENALLFTVVVTYFTKEQKDLNDKESRFDPKVVSA